MVISSTEVGCELHCKGGRRPPGLCALSPAEDSPGSWLARMAQLESASVVAFEHLANELKAHGFEAHGHQALHAATDEVRHTVAITRLALGFGCCPDVRAVGTAPLRSLEAVAIDNAIEGCGRELFGAVFNVHQAQTASDPRVRHTMAKIAQDELGHARLSLDLARAINPRLALAQRRRVREAQAQALEQMATDESSRSPARFSV